ncbi:MAG: hypothetical protein VCE74_19845, partial [Alphaproteobacteria bacterium]
VSMSPARRQFVHNPRRRTQDSPNISLRITLKLFRSFPEQALIIREEIEDLIRTRPGVERETFDEPIRIA